MVPRRRLMTAAIRRMTRNPVSGLAARKSMRRSPSMASAVTSVMARAELL